MTVNKPLRKPDLGRVEVSEVESLLVGLPWGNSKPLSF